MLQLHVPDKGIETVIISDGEISDFSLKLMEPLCHLSVTFLL